jgi:hypothetical protein
MNVLGIDYNGNGYSEEVWVDWNGDGDYDTLFLDTNEDGYVLEIDYF